MPKLEIMGVLCWAVLSPLFWSAHSVSPVPFIYLELFLGVSFLPSAFLCLPWVWPPCQKTWMQDGSYTSRVESINQAIDQVPQCTTMSFTSDPPQRCRLVLLLTIIVSAGQENLPIIYWYYTSRVVVSLVCNVPCCTYARCIFLRHLFVLPSMLSFPPLTYTAVLLLPLTYGSPFSPAFDVEIVGTLEPAYSCLLRIGVS